MESDFQADAAVLFFEPKAHTRWIARKYLLWPAFAYRVLAPEVTRGSLNVIEKAALGLRWAGEISPGRIAGLLKLHTDLAALVLSQLKQRRLLDESGRPTPDGLAALAEEHEETQNLVTGYVFQDPFSRNLWPRFVTQLEYAPLVPTGRRYPVLEVGTRGRPHAEPLYVVSVAGAAEPSCPMASQILLAVRRHRNAQQMAQRGYGGATDEEAEVELSSTLSAHVPRVDRVTVVRERPDPCYLTTFVYVPEDHAARGLTDWYACDPFGLLSSQTLHDGIEQRKRIDSGLGQLLSDLVARTLSKEDERDRGPALEELAQDEVERRLPSGNVAASPMFDALLAMEVRFQEISLFTERSDGLLSAKRQDVLLAAGKVIERLFGMLHDAHPTSGAADVLPRDCGKSYKIRLLNQYAAAMGFDTPLPDSLTAVRPDKVFAAAERGDGTLAPRILAALLAARRDVSHPLRAVSVRSPDLLARIGELVEQRDLSAHDSRERARGINQDVVERQRDTAYEAVRLLAELGT